MYESPIELIEKQRAQIDLDLERKIVSVVHEVGISVDKDELVRALKYDRDQYEKGFKDGRNSMIQLLLENDIYVCRLCECSGSPLDKFPCNKCKVAWPIFGSDYRFKLKED